MSKIILKTSLIAIVLAGILFACQHDFDEPDGDGQLSVAGARAWYKAHKPDLIGLKSGSKETKVKYLKPDWENAVKIENEKLEAVETGIMSQGGWGFATQESHREWERTGTFGYMASVSKLIVLRNKEKGEMVSFVMTIAGDKAYLERNKFDVRKNNYLQKDKDFSGFVFFHNLEGKFVNGWRFTEGKATHTAKIDFDNGFGLKLKSGGCYSESVYGWYQDCTTWYQSNNVNDEITFHMSCGVPYELYLGSVMVCNAVDDGGGSSGGGGGSGGGYDPAPEPPQPVLSEPLKRLFVNGSSNLSATDIENLNKAFNEMNNDCMLNSISNFLASNNITLGSVSINSTMPNPTSLNNFGDITFGDSDLITAENLSHEWVHLAQQKMSNVNVFTSSNKGMAEFEVALFFDIKNAIWRCGDFTSYTDHTMACYNGSNPQHRDTYNAWLSSITEGGTKYPGSIDQSQFIHWAQIFGQVSSYNATRGYQYNNSSYTPNTITQLINKCQ